MTETQKKEYLDSLFDEYHQLDYEDVIGGTVLTRFKYSSVKSEDFGLSTEEILLLDDKKLNQVVSIKKYRPYREPVERGEKDEKIELYKTIAKKKGFKQEVENQLKVVKEVQQAAVDEEKAKYLKKQLKVKGKKEKHHKSKKRDAPENRDQNVDESDPKRKRMQLYD